MEMPFHIFVPCEDFYVLMILSRKTKTKPKTKQNQTPNKQTNKKTNPETQRSPAGIKAIQWLYVTLLHFNLLRSLLMTFSQEESGDFVTIFSFSIFLIFTPLVDKEKDSVIWFYVWFCTPQSNQTSKQCWD